MTGTGKSTDPYIIMDIDDLYSMSKVGGADVYFKLGADIDYNGTAYAENFAAIPLNCAELNGDGHTLRNIYNSVASGNAVMFSVAVDKVTVKDLNAENVLISGPEPHIFMSSSSTSVTLEHCRFHMDIGMGNTVTFTASSKLCTLHDTYTAVNVDLCSFVIRLRLAAPYPFMTEGTLNRTQFRIDVTYRSIHASIHAQRSAMLSGVNAVDSYFLGTVAYTEGTGSTYYISSGGNHSNCYIAVKFTNISNVNWGSTIQSVCLFNSELNPDVILSISTKNTVRELSTEQMKDLETLQGCGFSCEG